MRGAVKEMTEKRNVVLFVDDEQHILNAIRRATIEETFDTVFAGSGATALQALEQQEISVIVTDMRMPVMDGYTAAQSIRKLPRADAASIRIYATTANTAPEDRTRAKEAGMNGFIAKPIDVKKLFEAIQTKKECEPS